MTDEQPRRQATDEQAWDDFIDGFPDAEREEIELAEDREPQHHPKNRPDPGE